MNGLQKLMTTCVGVAAISLLGAAGPQDLGTAKPKQDSTTTAQTPKKIAPKVELGKEVPNFTLTDTKGEEHSLDDLRGKVVVLEWYNPGCPYCKRIYSAGVVSETMEAMEAMGEDYVYIAVNSTGNMPEDKVIAQSDKFMKEAKLDIPILMDHNGAVGKMFAAKTTPHMYVIDAEGVLRYHGAFSDDPSCKKDDATNYVVNALTLMKAGETVAPDYARPWGCSVKYAASPKKNSLGG